jgi:hypothetical protein
MFHVSDDNHRFQARWPYIDVNHPNKLDNHIKVDSFVLDTINGLVELFIAMTKINKQVSIVNVHSFIHSCETVSC